VPKHLSEDLNVPVFWGDTSGTKALGKQDVGDRAHLQTSDRK